MKRLIPLLFLLGVTTPALASTVLHEPTMISVGVDEPERVLVAQADTKAVQVEPFVPPTTALAPDATAATAPTVTVPDPIEQPAEAASVMWTLYKAGHLVPMLIFAAFFVLAWLRKWIAWLRTGWRTVGTAALLGALAMLAERAVEGTTPNLTMIVGAIGVAIAMIVNGKGEPKQEAA